MLCSSPCSLVYGMVPFLNAILGTMLPMLSLAKQDNMKWVFSSGENRSKWAFLTLLSFAVLQFSPLPHYLCFVSVPPALCHFSDSILEYLANLDKAPDPTVRKDTFSSEIYAAFDILFNNWLQSRESKVRSLEVNIGGWAKWYHTHKTYKETALLSVSHAQAVFREGLREFWIRR